MNAVKSFALMCLASLMAFTGAANAVIDVTAATAGVGDAQTAVLAVIAVMVTFAVAVYGLKKVIRLFGR